MEETATQHSFPLPEDEKHKLDDVQEVIEHLPVRPTVRLRHQLRHKATRRVVDSFVRANLGMIICASLAAGLFCGFGYGRRR